MKFILYIAMSLDGFIADETGSVDWLSKYHDVDCGYEHFLEQIDGIVMGRTSYEQVLTFGDWPYPNQKSYVLSSKTIENPLISGSYSTIDSLLTALEEKSHRNIWIMGGSRTARTFLDKNMVDMLELFIIPELLGKGIRLFENSKAHFSLENVTAFNSKIAQLTYQRI